MSGTHSIASNITPTITYDDIKLASSILSGVVQRTPILTSKQINAHLNAEVFFKSENFQRTGSFKIRGAYNAISQLNEKQKRQGVITYSSGNHGQGVALACHLLNIPATIIMPEDAPAIKLASVRGYGAEVITYQRKTESREEVARDILANRPLSLIPPFDHPHVIAGQGTVAKELFEEVGLLDYLFVCIGGGGLISGCAIAANYHAPHCTIIGVEPERGNDAMQSLKCGHIVEIDTPNTIADGAQTRRIGDLNFPIIQKYVTDIITVTDEELRAQMRFFAERMKIVVEPTGCLPAAGALSHKIDLTGKRVGVIISGGNVDIDFFAHCITQ